MQDKISATTFASFCKAARVALQQEADRMLNDVEWLKTKECTWHPNGFAVFHIDDQHELGELRLHIWPVSERVTRAEAPPIHSHVWHLCSRVLVGTYTETLYEVSHCGSEGTHEYHSADIDYLVDRNSFGPSQNSRLRPTSTVKATAGQVHTVRAGVPHETLIESDAFVATLLLTSSPRLAQASVFSPLQILPSSYTRPVFTQQEKLTVLNDLNERLTKQNELSKTVQHLKANFDE